MARMTIKGTEEYALKLSKLGKAGREVAEKAIYGGAGMVADQIKSNLNAAPTVTEAENVKAYRTGGKSGISKRQKEGLIQSFGITKIQDDGGFYNVKLGFDGYNHVKTRKYPKGQPNQLIARVMESGSSYMDKIPFVRPAVRQKRRAAQEEMQKIIDEESKRIMG